MSHHKVVFLLLLVGFVAFAKGYCAKQVFVYPFEVEGAPGYLSKTLQEFFSSLLYDPERLILADPWRVRKLGAHPENATYLKGTLRKVGRDYELELEFFSEGDKRVLKDRVGRLSDLPLACERLAEKLKEEAEGLDLPPDFFPFVITSKQHPERILPQKPKPRSEKAESFVPPPPPKETRHEVLVPIRSVPPPPPPPKEIGQRW